MEKDVGTRVNLRIVKEFPWAQIPQSIHELMAHGGQLIEENNNFGLGGKAEHGVERGQKQVKIWRELGARKTNRYDNFKDALNHGTHGSGPTLRPLDAMMVQRHRKPTAQDNKRKELSVLVNSLFVDGIAPPDVYQFSIHPTPVAEDGTGGAA